MLHYISTATNVCDTAIKANGDDITSPEKADLAHTPSHRHPLGEGK